jgi:hypothetical protein
MQWLEQQGSGAAAALESVTTTLKAAKTAARKRQLADHAAKVTAAGPLIDSAARIGGLQLLRIAAAVDVQAVNEPYALGTGGCGC